MKAIVTPVIDYAADIKAVDIDPATEEEAQLTVPGNHECRVCPRSLVTKGPYRGFFVLAVLTFSGPDLPVGTRFSFAENSQCWTVFEKNKAARHIRFSVDEYEEDNERLKAKLRAWAENNGIEFGE